MNPLYDDDIENEFQQNVHDIKEQNNNIQTELSLEQIKIEYLLCNTSIKTYVIEIKKHLETIQIKTQNENINNHNVNFIIKLQVLIKQRNQNLKLPQISDLDELIPEISHPYSNITYTIDNTNPKLCHLPFNDMQSYDIENENENITFIDETNIYSPLHIKTIIKEKYKLNNLQAISFENFIAKYNK
jgi:hypothetical protein